MLFTSYFPYILDTSAVNVILSNGVTIYYMRTFEIGCWYGYFIPFEPQANRCAQSESLKLVSKPEKKFKRCSFFSTLQRPGQLKRENLNLFSTSVNIMKTAWERLVKSISQVIFLLLTHRLLFSPSFEHLAQQYDLASLAPHGRDLAFPLFLLLSVPHICHRSEMSGISCSFEQLHLLSHPFSCPKS